MRLWSIHPKYLDSTGLVACWREGLLAQAVIIGKTKGYKNHPQLIRFNESANRIEAIGQYLVGIAVEANMRGYNFNESKIFKWNINTTLPVTKGQLLYEFNHLYKKLLIRDRNKAETIWEWATNIKTNIPDVEKIKPHPLFEVIEGDVETWEKIK